MTQTEQEEITDLRSSSIAAVIRCIDRAGHENLDVRTIAREADYSPAALYSVAQNKAQLLVEAERELVSSLHQSLAAPAAFGSVDAALQCLADWWRKHPELGAFVCATARPHVPVSLNREWRAALAAWCQLPSEQSDRWWDELTVIVRATLGNLALSDPTGTPEIIAKHGRVLLNFIARAMTSPEVDIPSKLSAWIRDNPPQLQLDDPLVCALAEITSEAEEADEITVPLIAAEANVSVSSVYRAGGPTVLKQNLLDGLMQRCVHDLDLLDSASDRLTAMVVLCTDVAQADPVMFEFWSQVTPPQSDGSARNSWIQSWFVRQVERAQRSGELRAGAIDSANVFAALALAPTQVWAGKVEDRARILPWLLKVIHLAFAAQSTSLH